MTFSAPASVSNCMTRLSRIALFIDGPNLYSTARTLGFDLDFKRLLHEFQSRGQVVRAYYYTTMFDGGESSTLRPLVDWLAYNGFTVVTKMTEFTEGTGRRKNKLGVELAVDAMEIAKHVDEIMLFSGDGDFRPLVAAAQRRGVRLTVVSTNSTQPPMVADELRRQADVFIDISELRSRISRETSRLK
jgi:uncharacterized LabA/DUF88 family protein